MEIVVINVADSGLLRLAATTACGQLEEWGRGVLELTGGLRVAGLQARGPVGAPEKAGCW